MNPDVLERVLSCDKLPSLPAVAVRVIELTQDANVSIKDLAEIIQNDQGLSARVVRTVNSSFFGLRRKCGSINQAIVLLGLSAVKTLALGFSLVSAISKTNGGEGGFDFPAYWRRALYTGIAARTIAKAGGAGNEEECFLGGLLQDVGMVALHQALGAEYDDLMAQAAGDHRKLTKLELEVLETQHPDIGALLASRWRLPEELVMPIKYHERPSAAPPGRMGEVRAVALGGIAADVLTAPEPAGPLARFYAKAEEWFSLDNDAADEILGSIGGATREIARLLQVDAGEIPDAQAILKRARERLMAICIPPTDADAALDADAPDPVTGLPGRRAFDRTIIAAFEQAAACGTGLALAFFDMDGLGRLNQERSRAAGDAAVAALAEQVRREFAPVAGALLFAPGEGRIAVIAPKADKLTATRCAESVRRHLNASHLSMPDGGPLNVSVTIGLSCLDGEAVRACGEAAGLVRTTEQALMAAKAAGRNTLRVYAPAAA